MKFVKSLFIVGSLLLFSATMTSCEEEEILVTQGDGDDIPDTPDVD